MNDKTSWEKLRNMAGTENLIKQIEVYVNALKEARNSSLGIRFRPHLVFSGNPGTGKTTVARLLADILREEGLLERGHLIEATVGDLEGQYVGETRIKTQALCNRARGGVLFIDEAYGLMSGGHGDQVDYGKEAIEVLVQFMENNDDSLVILAGYKTDMENLIKNGNPGFMRRFNGKESIINFEDYDDKALYQIFKSLIKDFNSTPEFDDSIKRVISYMYLYRNARWGNAREMEKLANTIINRHEGKETPLSIEDIPDDKMRLIRDELNENEILEDIDAIIGLAEIKENLRTLLRSTIGGRKEAKHLGKIESEKPDLNFIFEGNPGTGKTTVASKMARILYELGLIDEITPVEIDTEDLIKSTVGDTPKAVSQMFKDHSGKVIIIDEAYKLVNNGKSAIDEITKCLTDKRFEGNQALVLAGYTKEIEGMLAMNSGMRRRFKNIWHFSDYTNEELWEIVLRKAKSKEYKFVPEEDCKLLAFDLFEIERRRGVQFGNAGVAIDLFNTVCNKYRSMVIGDNFDSILRPEHFPNFQSVLS
jgi:SpoVK/Ycf46/Vps4 family AAA+-type ATPase